MHNKCRILSMEKRNVLFQKNFVAKSKEHSKESYKLVWSDRQASWILGNRRQLKRLERVGDKVCWSTILKIHVLKLEYTIRCIDTLTSRLR